MLGHGELVEQVSPDAAGGRVGGRSGPADVELVQRGDVGVVEEEGLNCPVVALELVDPAVRGHIETLL